MKKLIPLFAVMVLASCGQSGNNTSDTGNNTPVATVPANWKTFSRGNYSIQYPAEWTEKDNQQPGFFLYAPVDSANPAFVENINLTTENIAGKGVDLDKYTESSITQLKSYLTNFNTISNKRLKNGTLEYQQLIFSGDKDSLHITFEQQYRLIKDTAYVLTLVTLKQQWEKSQKTGEQILSTFSVKQ